MNCSCDYDMPSFWNPEVRKARKQHRCYECSSHIRPGDTYEFVSGCWDGRIDTFKTCRRCVDLRQWVENNLPCFCWAHGNLIDDAIAAVDDAHWRAGEEVKGIRFGLARRLHRIRTHGRSVPA